jgi:3-mercaptopyruvate sulfurtransferase SseA
VIHQRPTGDDAFLCALYSPRATERNPPLRSRAVRTQFVDCRWELGAPGRGRELYLAGHIPGASFLDVDEDLSDLSVPDAGRHP